MFNPFLALGNAEAAGLSNLLGRVTTGLNSYGISTPNLGIQAGLNRTAAGNGYAAPAPSKALSTFADTQAAGPSATLAAPVDTTTTSASVPTSGFGSPNYYLHNQTVNGVTYNLADPAQQELLRQAQLANLAGSRDAQIRQLQQGVQSGLTSAQTQDAAALAGYNQNAADFGRQLANNIVDLGQGYDLGQVNNQQQFAGLSPNAFQSSQATSQQYGTDQYKKGLTQLRQQLAENVGNNYLTTGQIDPNSALGREIGLENSNYNAFTTGLNNSLQNGIQAANVAYQGGADQVNSNLQNLNAYAGTTQPNYTSVGYNYNGPTGQFGAYQTPSGNPYTLPSFNVSQYTPYTNAAQLGQSQQAQPSSPATWTGSGNPFAGLLGYNPTSTQMNYLNAFTGSQPAMATGS